MSERFHTIVIGAGSGGLTVAAGVSAMGRRVALVEARHVGGDCTNVGCVPSKTLIHQAAGAGAADPPAALAEVRRRRDALRERETHEFGELPNLTLIFGRARLLGQGRVAVALPEGGDRELSAEHLVIATGARPRTQPIPGLPPERDLTNESVFELPGAPRHLAILGGGVIGMELACAFQKLGSQVSVITSAARLMDKHIPEVADTLGAALAERGVAVYTGARAERYEEQGGRLHVRRGGETIVLAGVDYVLQAIGRRRNLEGLGLEQAGVAYTPERGIAADSYGQTSARGVYAIGDVTASSAFTHSANAQGRRVAQRILLPWLPARAPEPHYPSATFSDPEVATAGMGERAIAERYHPELVRRIRIDLPTQTDRGYTDGLRHGFIAVDHLRLTGQILGATIVGPRASELIPLFALAIQERISLYRIYRLVQPYPTYASGVQKVADAFMRATLPRLGHELLAYLRYRWGGRRGR